MNINYHTAQLARAIAEDHAAKIEALQRGLLATTPLTAIRLGELCALGEEMMHAARRRDEAESALHTASDRPQEPLDIVLPGRAH